MKETELRNELKETVKDTKNLSELIQSNIKAIDRLGRKLAEQVIKANEGKEKEVR